MLLQDYLKTVSEFHYVFRVHMAAQPSVPPQDMLYQRINLLEEEIKEFQSALQEYEKLPRSQQALKLAREDVADAIADILYVTAGAALAWGITFTKDDELAMEIQEDSFTGHHPLCFLERLADFKEPSFQKNPQVVKHALFFLFRECFLAAKLLCINHEVAFQIAHKSNMDKLWTPDDVARVALDKEIRFVRADDKDETKKLWIARRVNDLKVIKPPSWKKPSFVPAVNRLTRSRGGGAPKTPKPKQKGASA